MAHPWERIWPQRYRRRVVPAISLDSHHHHPGLDILPAFMAGAFSGHLVESFERNIVTSGSMSFNVNMHGTQQSQQSNQSFSMYSNSFHSSNLAFQEVSEATAMKIAALQAKLNQKLGPEYISQRPGPGGGPKLTYAEGWKIINLANEVFGFNGWSSTIVSLTTDFMDYSEESRRHNIGVSAVVRVTLRDGVFHEDVGYGMIENTRSKGQGLDKCKKEAVTDGLKRALRSFGNLLGNCLYDKSYTQEVIKIKVPPAKFNKEELHRRPEFQDVKPNISSADTSTTSTSSNYTSSSSSSSNTRYPRPQTTTTNPAPVTLKREPTPAPANLSFNSRPAPPNPPRPESMAPPPVPAQARPQPPSLQLPQAKPNPPPPRQVTFAASNAPAAAASTSATTTKDLDRMDEFPGFSDDDAFLAAIDLDGDLGPPINNDDDLGRPIEAETDTGPPLHYADSTSESISAPPPPASIHRPQPQPHANANRPANVSRTEMTTTGSRSRLEAIIAAQLEQELVEKAQQAANTSSSSTSSNSSSTLASSSSSDGHSGPSRISLPQASSSSGTRPNPNENRDPGHHGQQHQHQHHQQRSATPVGGFHFPPGVSNPMQGQGHNRVTSSASGIGVKRPLDMAAQGKAPMIRPGTGLQQPVGAGGGGGGYVRGGGERQVLGRLDVLEDGGDAKRLRR